MSLIVDEHRHYLLDQTRLHAFCDAIRESVKPGNVVVDLGSGTGILGLLACQAGAKRVYSIEESSLIELAREISRANGFGDRIHFLKGLSTRINLPEPADVILADQIGHFGFEAGLFDYFSDARRRFLKPGGITIPQHLTFCLAPVEHQPLWEQIEFWNQPSMGMKFHPARTIAANTGYPVKLKPEQLLGPSEEPLTVDPSISGSQPLHVRCTLPINRAGTLHGLGCWFVAQLSPSVTMSNSPLTQQRIDRRNVFFPLDRPVSVQTGDSLTVTMHILPTQIAVTWTTEIRRADAPDPIRFTHTTLKGMLISREDLQRTHPAFVPSLSPWGAARLTVLTLCDGKRPLVQIEQEVLRRHPDLFPSLSTAATFVAEVITRYSA
ncbi:MAG: class I SAM-dependent methyltransferase [Nitrospira sp.]|nr:class I SAM-dependent methyltransferase [Nitrospira sp.]MDH4245023.1 class I SAM-dependent methyltransferase [Nitrospira sp.]MDH4357337.1 class I SAM-dependent methyltransferase [Nitrospira sp.]MDH5319571.1 class I SAM-dependent methyltransferase [Nitrospira sp.]